MRVLPGKRFWKTAIAALAFAVSPLLPVSGAEIPGKPLEYHRYSGEAIKLTGQRLKKIIEKSIWDTRLPENQLRFALTWYTAARLSIDLSGLEHVKGFERASRLLPDGTVLNHEFLELDPSAPGLLNSFPAAGNRIKPAVFFSALPADTALAVMADIRPEALLNALEQCGAYREKLLAILPEQFPLHNMLRQSTGPWVLAMIDRKTFYLCLPDQEGMIFNFAVLLSGRKNFRNLNRVNFNGLTVVKAKGRVDIYSSAEAEKRFNNYPKVAERDFTGLPQEGFCAFYSAAGKDNPLNGEIELNNVKIALPGDKIPQTAVLSREKNGIMLTSRGSSTMLANDLEHLLLLLPDLLAVSYPEKTETPEKAPGGTVPVKKFAESCRCAELLQNPVLKAASRSGMAPGYYTLTAAGLFNGTPEKYDLVFLGNFDTEMVYPQFITMPHRAEFCVRFSDGTTEKFALNNPGSFRRIIGCLMTHKKYDEKLFMQLIVVAEGLDKQLIPAK